MVRLYPDEHLLAGPLRAEGRQVGYRQPIREQMLEVCRAALRRRLPAEKIVGCHGEPMV
jgi:hypothetical protein